MTTQEAYQMLEALGWRAIAKDRWPPGFVIYETPESFIGWIDLREKEPVFVGPFARWARWNETHQIIEMDQEWKSEWPKRWLL